MELADVSRRKDGAVEVDVLVSPKASRSGIGGIDEWRKRLIVKVRAPPVEGKANKEVADVFSEVTGCRAAVTSGMTSHQKTVTITGDPDDICAKLQKTL